MPVVKRDDILLFLNQYLEIDSFKDFTPKGLHVEGREQVKRVVTGVSANSDLINAAVEQEADMVIVHHGLFWEKESPVLKGVLKGRVKRLLEHDISLLAYHLPLDAHPQIGNNAVAAARLGLQDIEEFGEIGLKGRINPQSVSEFIQKLSKIYESDPLTFAFGPEPIEQVALCSGGAQKLIADALETQVDAFITGEVSEPTMHLAKEGGLHFFSVGHHASERLGIQRLGEVVANTFKIEVRFIDIENPV